MPTELTQAIVTGYTDYKDNDRMLTLFSASRGRIDCKARNCRKPTSRLLACAQPFVFGEFELFENGERITVNACDVRETFYPLREDVDRFMIASLCTSLCNNIIERESPDEALFSLLYHVLSFLAYSESDPTDLLIAFLLHYLDHAGYRPSLTRCAVCRRDVRSDAVLFFNAEAGGVVCAACPHGGKPVSKLALEAMRRILLLDHDALNKVVLKPVLREEMLPLLKNACANMLGASDRTVAMLDRI
ncbi:MAG: DNA repair protein RecO [Clostridia bacterium]|nr:DNA repair protein RecO [Clostridia bacterium]